VAVVFQAVKLNQDQETVEDLAKAAGAAGAAVVAGSKTAIPITGSTLKFSTHYCILLFER